MKTCKQCGVKFLKPTYKVSKIVWSKRKYCSLKCQRVAWSKSRLGIVGGIPWNKGIPITEQTRQKVIIARKKQIMPTGKNHWSSRIVQPIRTCERCKEFFSKTVKTTKKEWAQKRFCSITCANQRHLPAGQNADNFLASIRGIAEYKVWRLAVYERDEFTCQGCGEVGGKLNADHILPFSALIYVNNIKSVEDAKNCNALWNVSNGKTLCHSCHTKTATFGAKARKWTLRT